MSTVSAYTGLGLASRKVSNSSTESDSCFGSYTDELRGGGAGEEMLLSDLVISLEEKFLQYSDKAPYLGLLHTC